MGVHRFQYEIGDALVSGGGRVEAVAADVFGMSVDDLGVAIEIDQYGVVGLGGLCDDGIPLPHSLVERVRIDRGEGRYIPQVRDVKQDDARLRLVIDTVEQRIQLRAEGL